MVEIPAKPPVADLEPTVEVVSTECTHIADGLPDLVGGVPTPIPASLLPRALALKGVVQVVPFHPNDTKES